MAWWKEQKKRLILVCTVCFCLSFVYGQKDTYINPGLLNATVILSPSKMLNRGESNYYITGFLEGRVEKNISFRGEIHYMLANNNEKFLRNNLRSFFGIQYGIPFGNLELHTGFAPGFAIMKSNLAPNNTEFVPSAQLNVGVRFYVWKYFHFFSNFSYIHSRMNNLNRVSGLTDELMLTAGLGFNFQVLKKYR